MTVYTAAGAPVGLQTRWAKTANGNPDGDQWNLYYANDTTVAGSESAWTRVPTDFTFSAAGQLTAPTGGSANIPNLTVNDVNVGTISLNFGNELTSFASGAIETRTLQQDGFASGTLNSVDVTEDGKITGTYSNGTTQALAQVDVVQFNNADGLKPDSLGNYTQSLASGEPLRGLDGSTVLGGTIEQSNTDIAGEFSKMIVTQQAYSANTRVMSTAQTMISDLLNVIR